MNITIFYGGYSSEHEVSLRSATSVLKHIDASHSVHLIGISKKDGKWYKQDDSLREKILKNELDILPIVEDDSRIVSIVPGFERLSFREKDAILETDVVFPVLHGEGGEDGSLQGLLEIARIPYVGPSVLSSALAMDKEKAKILWSVAGIDVVPYVAIRLKDWKNEEMREDLILNAQTNLGYPMFVKPSSSGSSVGTSKVRNRDELLKACDEAFKHGNKILIEKFIEAREIECSVTGYEDVVVYTAGEIIPHHEFYDYNAKYLDAKGATLKVPADLDESTFKKLRELAKKAYEVLELSSLSRIDFLLDKHVGKIYLNEANTLPGFTSISMFPKLCEAAGLPYKDLIEMLLNKAIENYSKHF